MSEEVLRIWQAVRLAERLKRDMLAERPMDFVDTRGRSFLSFEPQNRGNAHPPQMFIYQPALEEVLRDGTRRFSSVEVLLEHEMRNVAQDSEGVDLTVEDLRDGSPLTIRAKYLLACDGGSSPTRTQLGIGFEGRTYEDPWLVIDTKVKKEWLLGLPPAAQSLLGADADRALERAFYDTALVADPPPLEAVSRLTSVRHIVFGSDWPFAERLYPSKGDPQPALSTVFSNRERHAIERLNGRREFRQLAPVVPAG
jgi:2-polyprenyl-6-methoxyphenol hydroxylase-like FAD-dependent oxidoreductase